MKILVFADTPKYVELSVVPDVIFLLGDMDPFLLNKIDKRYECPKFGVLGNHDAPGYFNGTSIVNVHKKVVEFSGLKIAGFEGCPKYNKQKYLQYNEEEVFDYLKNLEKVDFFLTHSNPMVNAINHTTDGHRGFSTLTYYINQKQPHYLFHGHLHEEDTYRIGDTTIHSVYPYKIFVI